ncbi:hypothetical protein H2201_001390 [Coniosporium apollinis]|uniref:BTB domain-containing protein n=2 Tax=Coniosporium TaxID=2810619 RepID=A0ABQ9P163_9PEZI|nr:hypothetical protein H2199_002479 [Cladosporium sp. JES 115]KAJ9668342.1 hypothetical protein H2201_001390 [Coniosporium apollinis]
MELHSLGHSPVASPVRANPLDAVERTETAVEDHPEDRMDPEEPDLSSAHNATEDLVEVYVQQGNTHKTWHLNKHALCHYSVYFHTACNHGGWVGGPLLLEDTDPAIFDLFVQFLSERGTEAAYSHDSQSEGRTSRLLLAQKRHARAWILGQRLASVPFMIHVLEKLAVSVDPPERSETVVSPQAVLAAFMAADTSSKLRMFFQDATAHALHKGVWLNLAYDSTWQKVLSGYPEFMKGVLVRLDEDVFAPADSLESYWADIGDLPEELEELALELKWG